MVTMISVTKLVLIVYDIVTITSHTMSSDWSDYHFNLARSSIAVIVYILLVNCCCIYTSSKLLLYIYF